jgi:signal transduction histidine kinase
VPASLRSVVDATTSGWRVPRLRTRLTLLFGVGGLLLSILVSTVTYGLVRSTLLDRREQDAVQSFNTNLLQANRLIAEDDDAENVRTDLSALATRAGTLRLIRFGGEWISTDTLAFGEDSVNRALLGAVSAPDAAPFSMRYRLRDVPYLVVGSPLAVSETLYFEATPLGDVEDTLTTLALTLLSASGLTTVASIALGLWASRRALSPLVEVSEAARAIAAGELDARLDGADDADLEVLVASFNDMADALQERIERDARFASDVSHELRSPLMTITTSVEILKSREDGLPERSRIALNLLSDDIHRFRQLVEDLLEMSRYGVGAITLEQEDFDAVTLVRQVARAGGYADIPIVTDADHIVVEGDKRRLGRVVANLLDNAAKYAGGPTAVRLERLGMDLRIVVEDRGPGVPPEERLVIFDRFARGSEGGRRGAGTGTGLGLALVNEHVRLHGGQVWVEDRDDGQAGAAFVVELPGVAR